MATLGLPLGFKRLNSFPIDSTSVFGSFSGLSGYAADSAGTAYIGQICSVTGSDKAYIIKSDRTLQEIGSNVGGNFYPLDSNPSGYITGIDTSNFYTKDNPSGFITGIQNLVYTTGNQIISGVKTFADGFYAGSQTSVSTLHVASGKVGINKENPQSALDVLGGASFTEKPTVGGVPVLLSGDINTSNFYTNSNLSGFITGIDNLVYTTGDQNISGVKNFYSIPTVSGIPLALSGQNLNVGGGELFTGNITVSIQSGKTFGQYKNGDIIPASGKTANEVIKMALLEALAPTVSLTSSSTIAFGATSANISLNFSKTINTQGASVLVNKIEKKIGNGSWNIIVDDINAVSPFSETFGQTQYDTTPIYYRYTVTDTATATSVANLTINPTAYAAPTISSVNVGSATRYKGDTATTYAGTITRNSPLIAITSYKLQKSINSGATWSDVGSSVSVTGNPATISVSLSETTDGAADTNLKNTNTVQYRISVTDTYQTTNLTSSTITFVHKRGIVYKYGTTLTIADIDAAPNLTLSNTNGGTYNNVTADFNQYVFYVYSSSLPNLVSVAQGATEVLTSFSKKSNLVGLNSNGSNVSYTVYVTNSDKAFTNVPSLVFS